MSSSPLLEARDVTVRFGGLVAVDNVSVVLQRAELVGIIGPNGAGKTTFFNAISGVQAPQIYMMALGLLLILSVLFLPGGLASLRWETFTGWRDELRGWWRELRDRGAKARAKKRAREMRHV